MAWTRKDYVAPPDAHDTIARLVLENEINVDGATLRRLIQLSNDYRVIYSKFYTKSRGLQKDGKGMGAEELDSLVKDPYQLKVQLASSEGASIRL